MKKALFFIALLVLWGAAGYQAHANDGCVADYSCKPNGELYFIQSNGPTACLYGYSSNFTSSEACDRALAQIQKAQKHANRSPVAKARPKAVTAPAAVNPQSVESLQAQLKKALEQNQKFRALNRQLRAQVQSCRESSVAQAPQVTSQQSEAVVRVPAKEAPAKLDLITPSGSTQKAAPAGKDEDQNINFDERI